jgi:hypothetical protein
MSYRASITALAVAAFMAATPASAQNYQIAISDASSLVRVGMNPHPTDATDTLLAYTLLSAIDREQADSLAYVCNAYRQKAQDDLMKEKSWGALAYILDRMLKERSIVDINENRYNYELGVSYMDFINECEHMGDYVVNVVQASNYADR